MKKVIIILALLLSVVAAMVFIGISTNDRAAPAKRVVVSGTDAGARVKPVLIIDAGHGGADGGATSDNGPMRESELNLDIARRLDLLAGFFGVQTAMTRESETIIYSENARSIHDKKAEDTRNRIKMINATENAVLISIHQNKYPSSGPFGAQVLYAKTPGSKEFAEDLQPRLISSLNPKNYRAAARIQDSIYIMNNVKCPAVLIECGFLSNPSEEAQLQAPQYRLKIAAAVAAGYLNFQNVLKDISLGGMNESQNSVLLY